MDSCNASVKSAAAIAALSTMATPEYRAAHCAPGARMLGFSPSGEPPPKGVLDRT